MTPQSRRMIALGCVALASSLLLLSCQTGNGDKAKPEPVFVTEFFPATFVAGIQAEKGPYPNLFAPDSYAVWLGSDVTQLRRAKALEKGEKIDPKLDAALERVSENYLIFECNLASAMPDMSIAYDVVGLRGITVHLVAPDGRKVSPMQVAVGSSASDELQGALRKYARTNVVVFQKKDLWSDKASINIDAPSARLVLEGFGTTFRFEWATALAPREPWIPNQDEYIKALKTGFKETCTRVGALFHTFD
jgi:hypothetical protein